ncbi:MAG: lactate utilization protein B [Gammaproteobacteria bacterium WSBS_2016_MAG_OTU1]
MNTKPLYFHRQIADALNNDKLRTSLAAVRDNFISHRADAITAYNQHGDFEQLREQGRQIRDESVRDMPDLLRTFQQNAQRAGATVLWAKDSAAACRLCADIASRHDVKLAVKSKSMASEEIELNDALSECGVEVVETDLGEFIIQQNNEKPSHIIAPAMHKRRAEVATILSKTISTKGDDAESLTRGARQYLRKKFLQADMGISGANFLIADTGSALIVTNEGNGRMTTTLPRVHVTLAGIDKIIPRWRDIPTMLGLLTRSATGQRLSNYVSISTGGGQNADGNQHAYIILLDNGRSRLRQSDCRDMLRCIRCGACMNHCPVYHTIGGHAYGATYMGPMGQVLTPALQGLENAPDLPHAATMCGACEVVCPVKIPLPSLMRRLRRQQVRQQQRSYREKILMGIWFFTARHPLVYAPVASVITRFLMIIGGQQKRIHHLPFLNSWFGERDLTISSGKTFRSMHKELGL